MTKNCCPNWAMYRSNFYLMSISNDALPGMNDLSPIALTMHRPELQDISLTAHARIASRESANDVLVLATCPKCA